MASARNYRIASIAGDGIGPEVVSVAHDVLATLGSQENFSIDWTNQPWGSDFYRRYGEFMPKSGLDELSGMDAIFFGAVGDPEIPDHLTLWGLLIPIRREFDQYVNLRPSKYVPGVKSPLITPDAVDLVIVRENSEGEYSEIGGRFARGTEWEFATQEAIFSRRGVRRIAEYAAGLANQRQQSVTSVTKSNGIIHSMTFWDEIVDEVAQDFPEISWRSVLIDAMAAELVLRPEAHDVVVCSNLFGDILSDLASATIGSLGLACSGNINPDGTAPSLFESVHGSAPDIVGKGLANPLAQVGSAAMMLEHLGEPKAAKRLQKAIDAVLSSGRVTPDLGGVFNTLDVQDALISYLETGSVPYAATHRP